MKSSFKIILAGIWMCAFSLSSLSSSANNIRINGTVQVSQGTGDTLVLSFPLRWDNSWRDQFNWDAAWIFFKYKSGTGGWNHVNLCSGGHRLMNGSGQPVPFDCMPGNTGSSTVGIFVYRNTLEAGNTPEIMCQVKCLRSALGGLTPEKFQNHGGFILAQAVEMVYVPYGIYYLGDGECSNRFAGGSDGSPVLIDSEDAITASTATKVYPVTNNTVGTAQSIAAAYPKGYKGFYVMKYEVSQEQWVYFLNMLTYVQQQERVPGLSGLKRGEYIFGSKNAPSNRNGIVVAEPSYNGNAVIFANNLNNNEIYSEDGDGKTIACNYLSPGDMLAYCSWSGLRPMSELEYEKACRSPYPERPIKGEYAWHDNGIPGRLNAVSNGGMRNERSNTANANVNAGNTFGPVRCGLFATGSSTQQGAGAAFWGGMELSGNLKEMCCNLAYTGFNGSTMGGGAYSTALWSVTPAHFGVRGGGFTSADSLLRISDRTVAAGYFADINKRDSTVGFRGTYPIAGAVNAGNIEAVSACPDNIGIKSATDATSNFDLSYIWYMQESGSAVWEMINGETGASLTGYKIGKDMGTVASKVYKFKRKAVASVGESTTAEISLTIPNMKLILDLQTAYVDACGNATKVTAVAYGNPAYSWSYQGIDLSLVSTYIPTLGPFNGGGDYKVTCSIQKSGCYASEELSVHIPDIIIVASTAVTSANCGNAVFIDSQDNNQYCTIRIDNACWMGENLKYKTGTNWIYNINKYGVYYNWATAMKGAASQNTNPSTVRGICPEGWHLPSKSEWEGAKADPILVMSLKSQLGGLYNYGYGWQSIEEYGIWWSTTGCYRVWIYSNTNTVTVRDCGSGYDDIDGMGVRCVKD